MGRLILCYSKKAEKPYYIKNMNLHLYTIEELCYYLYHNIYLIDENVIDDGLIKWIDEELELTELSEQLSRNRGSVKALMLNILNYTGYFSNEDIAKTDKLLSRIEGQSCIEKRMDRADHLLHSKKYVEAILEYISLYDLKEDSLNERILNNMGVAYAGMFLMNEAAKCFKGAYEMNQNSEIFKQLLYAVALSSKEEIEDTMMQYESEENEKILDIKMNEILAFESSNKRKQLNKVLQYKKDNQIAMYYEGLENLLGAWKKEYINLT
ncbi:MAG: hypothetical protein ACERKZ_17920 [Lachnotalea sp.]